MRSPNQWNVGPGELSGDLPDDHPWNDPNAEVKRLECQHCHGTGKMAYRGEGWAWCSECNGSGLRPERKKAER